MARNLSIYLAKLLLSAITLCSIYAADEKNATAEPKQSDKQTKVSESVNQVNSKEANQAVVPVRFDPLSQSAEEDIKVFIDLSKRDQDLRKREHSLKKEALLLRAAENSLDEKLKEFNLLKGDLDKLLKRLEEHENKQTSDLVKMYEAMKPKQAAGIFNRLELMLSIQLIKRMNRKKAALLLAAMDSQKAKDITQGLAKESQNIALVK